MLRSTTISTRSAISSLAKFTNKDEPARWLSGASSQSNGRLGLGLLRHTQTTSRYSDGVDDARTGICSRRAVPRWLSLSNLLKERPHGKVYHRFVTTVGLDLAKHVFQVHAIGAFGRVIVAKALRRKDVLAFFAQLPECLVGMEACGSAHHWALAS